MLRHMTPMVRRAIGSAQMRILGELIVVLGLAALVMGVAMRRVVGPALRRRQIAELERANRDLDERIERLTHDSGGNDR